MKAAWQQSSDSLDAWCKGKDGPEYSEWLAGFKKNKVTSK